jgi:heme O synthase-like polyprenyltransferase
VSLLPAFLGLASIGYGAAAAIVGAVLPLAGGGASFGRGPRRRRAQLFLFSLAYLPLVLGALWPTACSTPFHDRPRHPAHRGRP